MDEPEVTAYPVSVCGVTLWLAEVRRPGRKAWKTPPCRTEKEARAVAGTYLRTLGRIRLVQVESGRWELA